MLDVEMVVGKSFFDEDLLKFVEQHPGRTVVFHGPKECDWALAVFLEIPARTLKIQVVPAYLRISEVEASRFFTEDYEVTRPVKVGAEQCVAKEQHHENQ